MACTTTTCARDRRERSPARGQCCSPRGQGSPSSGGEPLLRRGAPPQAGSPSSGGEPLLRRGRAEGTSEPPGRAASTAVQGPDPHCGSPPSACLLRAQGKCTRARWPFPGPPGRLPRELLPWGFPRCSSVWNDPVHTGVSSHGPVPESELRGQAGVRTALLPSPALPSTGHSAHGRQRRAGRAGLEDPRLADKGREQHLAQRHSEAPRQPPAHPAPGADCGP